MAFLEALPYAGWQHDPIGAQSPGGTHATPPWEWKAVREAQRGGSRLQVAVGFGATQLS